MDEDDFEWVRFSKLRLVLNDEPEYLSTSTNSIDILEDVQMLGLELIYKYKGFSCYFYLAFLKNVTKCSKLDQLCNTLL